MQTIKYCKSSNNEAPFFFVPVMIEETLKAVMENTGGEDHGTNSSGCVKM